MEATKSCENEAMMVPTRVSSRLQNHSKIQYNIYNSSGNKVFAQHVEKIELGSKEESLVSTTKVYSQLENGNKIPDDINHKRGMISFDDNIVEKRTKLNSLRRKPCSHSSSRISRTRSTSNDSLVFDGLDFRGILSLRETSRLANLRLLAKVCDTISFHFIYSSLVYVDSNVSHYLCWHCSNYFLKV